MEEKLYELRPNMSKSLMFSLAKIVLIAGLFVGGFFYLRSMGIFEVFLELLKEMNLSISDNFISISFPFAVIFVAFIAVVLNYMSLSKIRYVCYSDHISLYKNIMIFQVNEIQIPYWNIKSIFIDPKQKQNIKIEASGLPKEQVLLQYLDKPQEAVNKINEIIRQFKANYYAEYMNQQKVENTINQY